jgi:DNA-binding transcriptional LysR family regulator
LRLRIAQPALSRQLMDLEQELGLKLFDRIGRGLALTRDGEQLVTNSRSVLSEVAFLTDRARLLRDGSTGLLKVACSPQGIESLLAKLLPRYARSYPNVEVKFTEAVGRDQLGRLERGEVDLGVGLLTTVQADDRFATHDLPAMEVLAACHPALGLGRRGKVEIAQLAQHPLLALDSSYVFRRAFDATCRLAAFEPNVVIESRAPHTLLALAEAGQGVAIIESNVPVDRYKLRIIRVTYRNKPIRLPLVAIWDKRRTLPPPTLGHSSSCWRTTAGRSFRSRERRSEARHKGSLRVRAIETYPRR